MGSHTAVVHANLTWGYLEVELFKKLTEIFSYDIVQLLLKN